MKKVVLVLIGLFSLSAFAQQGTLTVTVQDSGAAAPGVAVFYYSSPVQFFGPSGNWMNPDYANYDSWAYTSGNGTASFSLNNVLPNDTVYWATQDCSGNWVWGAGMQSMMNPNINGTLWLSCLPGACDAFINVDYDSASASIAYDAVALRDSNQLSSIPGPLVSEWTFGNITINAFSGVLQLTPATPQPSTFCYKVYANCNAYCDSITYGTGGGSGGGTAVTCNPAFTTDTLGLLSGAGYGVLFRGDVSISNGNIISYEFDFGDGTVSLSTTGIVAYYYAMPGFYNVCLKITSVLGADTCTATYCDSSVYTGSGGGSGSQHNCNAFYYVDTAISGSFQNQIAIWESSSSNGNIVSYTWDFGDGTISNTQYPSHTYASTGVYNVCLTIVSLQSSATGVDTCVSTFCDSVGFDANGNLVYKNGFTINVIDPATFSIEDNLLDQSLAMYPNPAREKVTLTWDASVSVDRITVFALSGQKVMEISPDAAEAEIDGLRSGAYLVRVESSTASKVLRLIVE